jgi:hypothetical protein
MKPLGYVDGRCSFESIMVKYRLDDRALHLRGGSHMALIFLRTSVSSRRRPGYGRSRTASR